MSVVMKVVFSLSLSGSILIVALLLCKPLLKNRVSRQWQYYIWLVVLARLLLPVAPEESAVGMLFSHLNQIQRTNPANTQIFDRQPPEGDAAQAFPMVEDTVIQYQEAGMGSGREAVTEVSVGNPAQKILQNLWIPWLVVGLLLLIRKITVYQSFAKYIRAGREEVSDTALLDRLARIGEQAGVRRPIELYSNSLVSSPLLIGLFRPCIVLPTIDLPEADFTYTVWHELIHYRQKDIVYKWLVQLTVCLHWFNPLVWLMGREINRACEFSCDETVLKILGEQERRAYGDTLLHALETGGHYKDYSVSVPLNESAELLKERLGAIMGFRKRSGTALTLSAIFTVVMMMGATVMGAYVEPVRTAKIMTVVSQNTSGEAAGNQEIEHQNTADENFSDENANRQDMDDLAALYYEKDMLVQFGAVFSALDESAQRRWLDTICADGNMSFFSMAVDGLGSSSPLPEEYVGKMYEDGDVSSFSVLIDRLGSGSPLIEAYAERAYEDGEISFFAVLTDNMDAEQLKQWQNRAIMEDMDLNFQSVLMDAEAVDAWGEKARKADEEQYLAWGIIRENDDYYYQGQLVHLFYDKYDAETVIRTVNINPLGTVDVKVIRNVRNQILSVEYMTEAEVTELFGTDALSGLACGEDEFADWEKDAASDKKDFEEGGDVFRLTADELPADVAERLDSCENGTWYVYHTDGRQYLCCMGFAWNYAYQPIHDENGWQIRIERIQKKDSGNLLLSLPDSEPVKVYCDGQEVEFTEIEG